MGVAPGRIYIVSGIYLSCAVLASAVIMFLLDPLVLQKHEDKKSTCVLLNGTLRHLANSYIQMFLIPLTIYIGFQKAFFWGDFTRSYVTCTLGVWAIGYIAILYGSVVAVCSYMFGRLMKCVGRMPLLFLAAVLHLSVQIALLLWRPNPDVVYIYYILAGLWGAGDAALVTQLNALYGFVFIENTEAAFANYKLWESIGFIVVFSCNDYIVTSIKLYMCMCLLALGMTGYTCVEILQRYISITKS